MKEKTDAEAGDKFEEIVYEVKFNLSQVPP